MTQPQNVLITGGSGRLARMFLNQVGHAYHLRLTYHKHPFEAPGHEVIPMDLANYDEVFRAAQGMDAVVHFGADAVVRSPWETVLSTNIVGTYNAYEAAHQAGVKRFVFASSNHAAAMAAQEGTPVGPAAVRPDSLYGVSKCFGEALGRYYHDLFGMQVICLRIGSCGGQDDVASQRERMQVEIARGGRFPYTLTQVLGMWLSPRDMAQLLHRSLETDCPFGIFYGISDNTPPTYDLSDARRLLGYAPQDNVQNLLDAPIATLGR
jgi:NAD+ dependent glucose-6-phosphate dehydrogenase